MKPYIAVIDTNVIVSALLTDKKDVATVRVLNEVAEGHIVPLYHADILAEYNEVLRRNKFPISEETAVEVVDMIRRCGQEIAHPPHSAERLLDEDDRIFYETALAKHSEGAYLISGNKKHYPPKTIIVSPSEMMAIVDGDR